MPAPPAPRHLLAVDDEPHIGLLLRPHLELLRELRGAPATRALPVMILTGAPPASPPSEAR